VTRLDPVTGTVRAEISTELGPQGIAAVAGSLWVSSLEGRSVQAIDPATDEAGPPIETELLPDGLLAHGGSLWVVTDMGPLLQRIDPTAGKVTGTWAVSDQGAIDANQLLIEAGGDFWFPLL
jgi:virginiamycin B lyase